MRVAYFYAFEHFGDLGWTTCHFWWPINLIFLSWGQFLYKKYAVKSLADSGGGVAKQSPFLKAGPVPCSFPESVEYVWDNLRKTLDLDKWRFNVPSHQWQLSCKTIWMAFFSKILNIFPKLGKKSNNWCVLYQGGRWSPGRSLQNPPFFACLFPGPFAALDFKTNFWTPWCKFPSPIIVVGVQFEWMCTFFLAEGMDSIWTCKITASSSGRSGRFAGSPT